MRTSCSGFDKEDYEKVMERRLVGEIAYVFERQAINTIFNTRDDKERYRMIFKDIYDDSVITKSEEEKVKIEELKKEWMQDGNFTQLRYLSRAIKQFKSCRLDNEIFASCTSANHLRRIVEGIFDTNDSSICYEKKDILCILSYLENIAEDKTHPLKY